MGGSVSGKEPGEAATGRAMWTYTYKWGDKPITGIKGRHQPEGPQNFNSRVFWGV